MDILTKNCYHYNKSKSYAMSIFEEWVEQDYNPFILFDKDAKVLYVNKEAQFLLGTISHKEIFKLATSYAGLTYGFKTTIMDIEYDRYSFFGFTVGYQDDEKIGIKLYKKPIKSFALSKKDNTKANIYTLIDLSISSFLTRRSIEHKKILDPTFPEFYIDVDQFLKLLGKVYESFKNSPFITTKLSLLTGEYIVYKDKKYPILSLKIFGKNRDESEDNTLKRISSRFNASLNIKKESITILLPMVI